ncbi:hypothetical protein WMY93_033105 [Mugilogobius chulae]|uniref:Lipoxygenase domain-containing protein n=1 Tax=Mugilogobius chulae TaxID=88201 RepID=A0AAW0MUS5_9GOBI
MWFHWGSNPGPSACKADVITATLWNQLPTNVTSAAFKPTTVQWAESVECGRSLERVGGVWRVWAWSGLHSVWRVGGVRGVWAESGECGRRLESVGVARAAQCLESGRSQGGVRGEWAWSGGSVGVAELHSRLWLSLIGSEGETPPTCVTHGDQRLLPGSSCSVSIPAASPLGSVLLIRLRLEPLVGFPDLNWHCERAELRLLEGAELQQQEGAEPQVFHCHRWICSSDGDVEIRSEQLVLAADETQEKLKLHRIREIQLKRGQVQVRLLFLIHINSFNLTVVLSSSCIGSGVCFSFVFVEGAPHCLDINIWSWSWSESGLGLSSQVNLQYLRGFLRPSRVMVQFSELSDSFDLNSHGPAQRTFYAQTHRAASCSTERRSPLSGLSLERPYVPRQSLSLPPPVKRTHETEPEPDADRTSDQPAADPRTLNPVFLPSDSSDWLMAKLWLRLADFQVHQLDSHFLRTHMMSELCAVATVRNLPSVHPLHQLLMSHLQTSLQINFQARTILLNSGGVFDKAIGCGLDALPLVLSRSASRLRFRSLCVPLDLEERGLSDLPRGTYGSDALRVWSALLRFVIGWLDLCYRGDEDVQRDSELQTWVRDIYDHGFPPESGFPQRFQTKAELAEFVTVVIFSCSALHAAVNFSQVKPHDRKGPNTKVF